MLAMALESIIHQRRAASAPESAGAVPAAAAPTGADGREDRIQLLIDRVRSRLLDAAAGLDLQAADARERVRDLVWRLAEEEESRLPHLAVSPAEKAAVQDRIVLSMFGYGILDPLLQDPAVTEIMVNGPDRIFIERHGQMAAATDPAGRPLTFADSRELFYLIEKIVSPLNRKVDESDPIVDARLPDGSRVNVVLRPVALDGPIVTIRKFPKQPFTMADLVDKGTLPPGLAAWLQELVKVRYNLVVSGGTATGKTTFLNALGMAVGPAERVVTVEDAAELQLRHLPNLVRLETRPANIEGRGEITMRHLVRTALRMRPDRIIVGEVRGGEALDMLQAMNTGHDGSLTTAHANSARDLLSRIETMVLLAGIDLPLPAIRSQIAGAVEIIVHLGRSAAGRQVVQVTEVVGLDRGEIATRDLFHRPEGGSPLTWTGQDLSRTEKYRRAGRPLPDLGRAEEGAMP